MKKLLSWLNKHDYTHKPAFYTGNYFYNAPEIKTEAAEITITSKNIREVTAKADTLRKYAGRYKYQIMIDGRIHCDIYGEYHQTIILLPDAAAAALENYYFFADAAAAECELLQHEYYMTGRHAEVNAAMLEIMNKYGAMYNRSLIKIIAA